MYINETNFKKLLSYSMGVFSLFKTNGLNVIDGFHVVSATLN